ncbi:Fic family protein [Corynebacterium lizhenjunii]|uniref:Fic family protein n=1 Tax=Corynebacterium lizhenjunii TaxID=2709394 RepID=A0A7T0KG77_9CORY|nr:Fic family protein [Corynebacterium lizhenjunii]QPK80032.1 Fic family protein [Corynebacterium lizhenjunii]
MWPTVTYEELTWSSSAPLSRRMRAKQPRTYCSSIVAPIAEQDVALSAPVVTSLTEATAAIARFDQKHAGIVAPFAPLLLRGESFASSRIEQLSSSARRILEAEAFQTGRGNAALISANTTMMRKAIHTRHIDSESIRAMHALLLGSESPHIAGVFRNEPVWIGGSDAHPVGALFVPPHHSYVQSLLEDLTEFIRREDIPALAKAALAHAQFETIHPFADGNGRTGRALVHAILGQSSLTTNGVLPISAALLSDTQRYFAALDSYRDGDVAAIISLFSDAAVSATMLGSQLGSQLMALRTEWAESTTLRADSAARKILDYLIQQPVVDAAGVAEHLNVSPATARRALERLEDDGIVRSSQVTKAKRAWHAPEVLELLDAFADANRRLTFRPDL